MKKLTDEEIDSLFKEAAANYEPAYHPSEWEVMNKKLQGKPFRIPMWIIIAGIGSLIFLSGIGVGVWMNNDSVGNLAQSSQGEASLIVKSDTVSKQNRNLVQSNGAISPHQSGNQNGDLLVTRSNEDVSKGSVASSSSIFPSQVSKYDVAKEVSIDISDKERIASSSPNSNDLKSTSLNTSSLANASILNEEAISQQSEQIKRESLEPLLNDDSTSVQRDEANKKDSTSITNIEGKSKNDNPAGKWFIKVMASPDNSSINFSSSAFAGSNFAALIEYQLTNRWSLSTGAILSNKKYTTDAEVIYSGKKANGLDGSCQVIDIPITVYYRISTRNRFSFYSGVGLSSYLMQSENYRYSVIYNSVSYPYDAKVEGKNNEWFKVINLSLGVNYLLTQRWSLQAEPFAKLPMAGVGEGKVLLSTTGLFLGIKYKIH